ncbi:N-acetyltransferase [Pseudomonas moraviensis]|uniref:N-acetyltransferase n=1 Tax=Pseudomonas moraviensis TaxID=321662 RepID=UPI002093C02B|nr:N-acetyltransferase [Pseudomonas moraviensis]UST64020.1 N-acetyltransferase [Pseudomonas moraviensis]
MKNLKYCNFSEVDLTDTFFDSLKLDYEGFETWFDKKRVSGELAYVFYNSKNKIDGFLYLKSEVDIDESINPPLPVASTLKVGTLKINAHGTKLGERFIKKIFDHAISGEFEQIYVTVFSKHSSLIELFERYGFECYSTKTTRDGEEQVLIRQMTSLTGNVVKEFPLFGFEDRKYYLLAIYPKYHSAFLPDSILNNESHDIVQDVSHTNSIHKVFISGIARTKVMQPGDLILIYRTSDGKGKAYYRSVASSIGVIEEVRQIKSFSSETEFMKYAKPYSIFTKAELKDYFTNKKKSYIIKFTYNAALKKRIIRKRLMEECMISTRTRWDFMSLTEAQIKWVAAAGEINESLIID